MKNLINDRLTEDEINELNKVLTDKNINFDDGDRRVDNKFLRAVDYFYNHQKIFGKMSFIDIFKWFYYLGVNTEPDYKEISMEEVMKMIDDKNFIEMVSNCIKNPMANEKYTININAEDNSVCLTQNCIGSECPCSPQREDCCRNNYGDDKCSIIIPMSKFNEMINFKEIN
jgi:hypothetical protein